MVSLADARRVIAAAEKKAVEIGQPMNIAVADEGGNIVAHVRMDGAWIGSIDISQKKAYTSRAFDITTKDLATHSQSGGQFFGIHASNDGKIIRVPIPSLTEERRKDLVKKVHHIAEDHRVAMRNVRRDSNEHIKKLLKDKLISEDEDRRAHDEIQKLTDVYIQRLDQAVKSKEKEMMEMK